MYFNFHSERTAFLPIVGNAANADKEIATFHDMYLIASNERMQIFMSTFSRGILLIAFIFACVSYVVCSFFVDSRSAVLLGVFTGAVYYIALSIWDRSLSKKAMRVLDSIEEEPLYKHISNYYEDELICAGWLFLTKSCFMFITLEKKNLQPIKIPINEVVSIKYGEVFKHIMGMNIARSDETKVGFSLAPQEFGKLEEIYSIIVKKGELS